MAAADIDDARVLARELGGPVLALDASGARASLAVVTLDLVDERVLDGRSMPSEALAGSIRDGLTRAGLVSRDLRAVVIGLGPGSFTGLRVALATVKGLAYGAGLPLYGVSSLALVAAGSGPGLVAPLLDARRGEVFCALYEVDAAGMPRTLIEDAARTPDAFAALLGARARPCLRLVGDAALSHAALTALAAAPPSTEAPPRALAGLFLARDRLRAGLADELATLVPRYLRESEAERLARGGHVPAPPAP